MPSKLFRRTLLGLTGLAILLGFGALDGIYRSYGSLNINIAIMRFMDRNGGK